MSENGKGHMLTEDIRRALKGTRRSWDKRLAEPEPSAPAQALTEPGTVQPPQTIAEAEDLVTWAENLSDYARALAWLDALRGREAVAAEPREPSLPPVPPRKPPKLRKVVTKRVTKRDSEDRILEVEETENYVPDVGESGAQGH
jgi:hypothetical protein